MYKLNFSFLSCSCFSLTIVSIRAVHSGEHQTRTRIRSHVFMNSLGSFQQHSYPFSNFCWMSSKVPEIFFLKADTFLAQRRMLNHDESEFECVLSLTHTQRGERHCGLTRRERQASIFSFHRDGSASEISNRHTEGAFMSEQCSTEKTRSFKAHV